MAKLTPRQQLNKEKHMMFRIWAASELAGRYLMGYDSVPEEISEEAKKVLGRLDTTASQKKAAKVLLQIKYGKRGANDIIEDFAIVTDRRDSLVNRWVKKVKERDEVCQLCGGDKKLSAHHISHWANDPVNRINVDNGILLCSKCHSLQHPELPLGLFIKGGDKDE